LEQNITIYKIFFISSSPHNIINKRNTKNYSGELIPGMIEMGVDTYSEETL